MRTIWTRSDGLILDWHRELIDNHVEPAMAMNEAMEGCTWRDFDSIQVDDDDALYGVWDGNAVYLCNPSFDGMSEDLMDSIKNDSLKGE